MKVLISKTDEIKEVQDKEVINGVEILYMTDNTSYSEHQVFKFETAIEYLKYCSQLILHFEEKENERLKKIFSDPEFKKKDNEEWKKFLKSYQSNYKS